jgi:hypothetical protein
MANYKFQNLVKITLGQDIIDNVVCFPLAPNNGVEGENTLQWYILNKKMYSFFNTFCIILGTNFFHFI